jgi:dTDP-4-dehydrorhamnose reductase
VTRVIVTGARGLLGAAITREFQDNGDVQALDRTALDITDERAVDRTVREIQPDVIVNCAAFNDVDGAEDDAAQALAVNGFGVRALARAAGSLPCTLVHYSTDFVFDGDANRPYTEEDEPHPRSVYGLSKLLGEWYAAGHPRAFVLRVESLFGEPAAGSSSKGSLHGIVTRIRAQDEVPVFVDRTVSPSYTVDVARATRALLESNAPAGLYHCVNSGAATWDAIAGEAATLLGRPLRLKPLTLESASLRAARPRYCALSPARLASAGIVMPSWQDALRRHLQSMSG